MSHDELSELLRELPRGNASQAFTAQTLARLAEPRRRNPQLRSALAFVLAALVLLTGAIGVRRHQHELQMQRLRAEQQQIKQELENLKAISEQRNPRVLLGSSGSVDFVVGLGAHQPQPKESQPVSLVIADDGTY